MLVIPADRVVEAEQSAELGVHSHLDSVDWPAIRDRIFGRIDPIAESGRKYRIGQDFVEVFEGDARFTGPHTIEVNGTEISARHIVLAAGARPYVPDLPGLAGTPFHTSDTIMRIDRVPERLIIMGGGFIAAEMGHVFASMGSHVSVVHRGEAMLRHEDVDVSVRFTEQFAARAYVHLNSEAVGVDHVDGEFIVELNGGDHRHVGRSSGSEVERRGSAEFIRGDALLVAAGRTPNGRQLGVETAGVRLDPGGYVITDDYAAHRSGGDLGAR